MHRMAPHRLILIALATLVPLLATPAQSQASKTVSTYEACMASRDAQTTIGMTRCAAAELAIQDARLNRAYKAALARRDDKATKAALLKAQRAWIAFRDADCAAARATVGGGTLVGFIGVTCEREHTARRADALETFGEP